MQIEYMREFLATADIGSFTNAAELIYTTQPVLSKHIRDIEETLGGKVFERSHKRLHLTPLGEQAYSAFQQIIAEYDQLLYDTRNTGHGFSGTVRIDTLSMTASNCILPFVEHFQGENPHVSFSYKTANPSEIIDDLIVGNADVGLLVETDYDDRDLLSYAFIGESLLYLAVSSETFQPTLREIGCEETGDRPLICLSSRETTRPINRKLITAGFNPSRIIYVDEVDIAAAEVLRSDGYFAIPSILVPRFTAYSHLLLVPTRPKLSLKVYFARKTTNNDPTVLRFLEMANEQVNGERIFNG